MNATDLMLGDYVQIEDSEGNLITDYICDIGYVPQWNELGVRTCKCGDEWLRESEIIPLPLTSKILEKNGFILDSYSGNAMSGKWWVRNDFIIHENMNDSVGGNNFKYRYVHELQHALKLCRVNKEIIL